MALVVDDRIKETTTTTGTSTYTLAGAVTGFQAFSEIGDGNTTYYCCTDGTDFEVGIGTYTASGTTLARTTILQSSNSDAAVNWGAGTRDIFVTLPAEKAVLLDSFGDITFETSDANKTILFDKSANALHFKRPSGPDAYGKSPEILFNFAGSSKIFDEFTQGSSNLGFNIVANSKLHFDAPNITYRDGSADGNEFLESSFTRSGTSYSWNQHHQPENSPSTHPTFCWNHNFLYTSTIAQVIFSADFGSNTNFDANGLEFVLDKEQDTVADDDDIALIIFRGNNSAGTNHSYAKITATMQDVTDDTEDGILKFSVSRDGAFQDYFQLDGEGNHTLFFKPIAFEGSTADAYETTLDVVDPTQDNTLNLPDESGTIATRAHAVALASVMG